MDGSDAPFPARAGLTPSLLGWSLPFPASAGTDIEPSAQLHALWGKTNQEGDGQLRHPLMWHLLDSAAVAGELWDHYVSKSFQREFCDTLGLTSALQGKAWLQWFTCMHDLGKASALFQCQGGVWAEHAEAHGMPCLDRVRGDNAHEFLGASMLKDSLLAWGMDFDAALAWATSVNIEHGRAPDAVALKKAKAALSAQGHLKEYRPVVSEVMELCAYAVGVEQPICVGAHPSAALLNELAGLVKTSDWLSSNPKMFTYLDEVMGVRAYFARAVRNAHRVAQSNWLTAWNVPNRALSFEQQFGEEMKVPRPMQGTVIEQARDLPLRSIMIVEAQMGQGKTEAALGAALEFARKGATGIFFALPTQATARSIHARTTEWLERTGLSRKGAILNASDWSVPTSPTPAGDVGENSAGEASLATEQSLWFRGHHRAMLSKVGVGTVDQVLLAAQPVRYDVSRWSGLAGRVVVFDEVHAYDTFMNTLFCAALKWLAQLGCPVILLSATLPSATRTMFVNAYRSGARGETVDAALPPRSYPAVTVATAKRADVIALEGAPARIELERVTVEPDTEAAIVVDAIAERVGSEQVGAIGVVCNSVPRAVEVYEQLLLAFPRAEVVLLHSRFATAHRGSQTQAVMAVAGGGGKESRKERLSIVVGTQVIEQSLDLDFDWMITELAPVDLVLQRAGRLHRWSGTSRPTWGKRAVLTLLEPQIVDGVPDLKSVAFVYAVTAPTILLSSWGVLRSVSSVEFPQGIDALVSRTYDTLEEPASLPPEVWAAAKEQEIEVQTQATSRAMNLVLPDPWLSDAWAAQHAHRDDLAEDGGRFRSRDGEPSITVALARRGPGGEPIPVTSNVTVPFGGGGSVEPWRLACVSIRESFWRGLDLIQPKEWERGAMQGVKLLYVDGVTSEYTQHQGLFKVRHDE